MRRRSGVGSDSGAVGFPGWEAKVQHGKDFKTAGSSIGVGEDEARFTRTAMTEVRGEADVDRLVRNLFVDAGRGGDGDVADAGLWSLRCWAEMVTRREEWTVGRGGRIRIVLDDVSASEWGREFRHLVGEVETTEELEAGESGLERIGSLEREVDDFMESYRWAFAAADEERPVLGKLSAYLLWKQEMARR